MSSLAPPSFYDVAQTFYVDKLKVGSAATVKVTSIDLYFKSKPTQTKNVSGIDSPGVGIWICPVVNDIPDFGALSIYTYVRNSYDAVQAYADASQPTTFTFNTPITVATGGYYAIVVKFDDPGYKLWTNKQGDALVGTNTPSPGSTTVNDGKYYTNISIPASSSLDGTSLRACSPVDTTMKPFTDTDLKFKVKIAKYVANTVSVVVVNKNYEFITFGAYTGSLTSGEYVYQKVANSAGTVSVAEANNIVIGTGTNFTSAIVGSYIVIQNSIVGDVVLLKVSNVTNTTHLSLESNVFFTNTAANYMYPPVAQVFYKDYIRKKIHFTDSSANTTVYFSSGSEVWGATSKSKISISTLDDYPVDHFVPKIITSLPQYANISHTYALAYSNGSQYIMGDSVAVNTLSLNEVKKYKGVVRSRSSEVSSSYLYGSNRKSFIHTINLKINKPTNYLWEAPQIHTEDLDVFVRTNKITALADQQISDPNNGTVDTEVYPKGGLAGTKHITKKVSFANNRFAEDVRVFLTAHRPTGTDVLVYCKIHNSADPETFDDKSWTPLTIVENAGKYSSSTNTDDIIEYTYGLPAYSPTANALPGTFSTQVSNNIIVGTGVVCNTYVAIDNLVKIYNPLFPQNYMVAVVAASNTSTITLGTVVSNTNLVGTGFKVDRLKYNNIAFNDVLNYNICSYYNLAMANFDKYDSMQIKVVLAASNTNMSPTVDQIQVVGASA